MTTALLNASTPRFDVAIVGYGPTGATLANLLGQLGLQVAVFDREPDLLDAPRAVHFDGEVMRIFQRIGLADALEPTLRPSGGMQYFNAAGRLLVERAAALELGPHGWLNNYLFHQPALEHRLRGGVARFGNVVVRLSTEVLTVEQDAAGATLQVRTAASESKSVRARFVVGCDGARSMVRQAIGSDHLDLGLHQAWLVVDILLTRPVELPPVTVQYCDPARPTTYVRSPGDRRRWEIMLMPGDDPETITQPEHVWALLDRWVKPTDAVIERGAVYTFHSLIATRWRAGHLLIAGDAAHQTPPFLGQGMCAGIRDAANLGWKLARVIAGRSPPALLDSYESERAAHTRHFIELAVKLGDLIQTTDPVLAAARDRRFLEGGTMELVNLSPPLGPGIHHGPVPSGEIFPQPRLTDGRRMDDAIDVLDERDAPFAAVGEIGLVSPFARATLERLGTRLLSIDQAGVTLVRPDRYVFGHAGTRAALDTLVQQLDRVLS